MRNKLLQNFGKCILGALVLAAGIGANANGMNRPVVAPMRPCATGGALQLQRATADAPDEPTSTAAPGSEPLLPNDLQPCYDRLFEAYKGLRKEYNETPLDQQLGEKGMAFNSVAGPLELQAFKAPNPNIQDAVEEWCNPLPITARDL